MALKHLKSSTKLILNHASGNKALGKILRNARAKDMKNRRKILGPLASRKDRQHYQNFQ